MKKILCFLSLFWLITVDGYSQSEDISNTGPSPVLAFSDLINGPASGLGDGLGEGAIVTVWGYHLGEKQGQVFFTDSTGKTRPAAHIYYWKKADGKLPGGPANLYRSHTLYEIAFSIPKSELGRGLINIKTAKGDISNHLGFDVIDGRIFHVMNHGDNKNAGNFDSPWKFINGDKPRVRSPGNANLKAGDIVYSHNVAEVLVLGAGRAAIFLRQINGTAAKHVALVSYPGTVSTVVSETWGLRPYLSTGIVVSKYKFAGGNMVDPNDDSDFVSPPKKFTVQIRTSKDGRIVGNHISDIPGRCSNGQAGSISGTGNDVLNIVILGNEITDIGCRQTSHFHHTTYISQRKNSGSEETNWQFAWNFLHNNMARYGIHYYDQSSSSDKPCAELVGTLNIHDNLIVDQRGPGINVVTTSRARNSPCWTIDTNIYRNILINTGLGPRSEPTNGTAPFAIKLGGAIKGNFYIYNNLIHSVSDYSSRLYNTPEGINVRRSNFTEAIEITENIIDTKIEMLRYSKDASIKLSYNYPENESFSEKLFNALNIRRVDQEYIRIKIENNIIEYEINDIEPLRGLNSKGLKHDFYGYPFSNNPIIGPVQNNIEN